MGRLLLIMFFLGFACQGNDSGQTKKDVGEVSPFDISAIQQQATKLELQSEERIWERIPWTSSLNEAKSISQESDRPIFIFSMHGNLDGRC